MKKKKKESMRARDDDNNRLRFETWTTRGYRPS